MGSVGKLAQLLSDPTKQIVLLAIIFFRSRSFSKEKVKRMNSEEQTKYWSESVFDLQNLLPCLLLVCLVLAIKQCSIQKDEVV